MGHKLEELKMNIKPVYLPKTIAAIVAKINDEMIERVVYQKERVTPSDLRLTADDARRLCGAKLTSETVIKGLAYALTVYAYKGGLPLQGIPSAIASGITHGQSLLARGQGIDGLQLRAAVMAAAAHIAALPQRQAVEANEAEANEAEAAEANEANEAEAAEVVGVNEVEAALLEWAQSFWAEFWSWEAPDAPAAAAPAAAPKKRAKRAKVS